MTQKRYILTSLSFAFTLFAGCATATETEFSEALRFSGGPYCEQVVRDAPKEIPDDILSILENEVTAKDGYEIANAMLVTAAIEIAHASENTEACRNAFRKGEQLFYRFLESKQNAFQDFGGARLKRNADIRDVQTNLIRLWREDQSARGVYVALQTDDTSGASYWAERLAAAHTSRIDETSKQYIKTTLDDYDWIDRRRFGRAVSNHAWLLVQHADDDPAFQRLALERMEGYLDNRGIDLANYAFLWDRVAVNTGREQRYGTQPDWNCVNGKMKLQPLEDPENVNQRRKGMGLGTVEEGLDLMNFQTCHSSK